MLNLGTVRPGTTIYIPFDSFDGGTGASITMTGIAVTDVEIYKDGSVTQRASDTGYTLLDTDGIDFDGLTGIHGFSIDLASNATAGFFSAGSRYFVAVASITIDAQTVNFVAACFDIGYPDAILNTTIATLASQTSFTLTVGPAEDDALNGMSVIIHDVASAVQLGHAVILDYTGSTRTVTLVAGTTFTAAATDNIAIMRPMPLQPTVTGRSVGIESNGKVTGVLLTDTVTTYTGNTVQTGDAYAVVISGTHGNPALKTLIDTLDNFVDTEVGAIITTLGTPAGVSLAADLLVLDNLVDDLESRLSAARAGYLDSLNGNVAQSGDSYARLGAPAGASVSVDIAAIEAQTDDIGAAGAGLTAADDAILSAIAALNNLSAAQVNAEVDTALVDIHLDHLLAVDYNPASQPGVATALLNELVESDSGVSRFTVNALENGPSGSGSSPEAIADEVQTRTIAAVTLVATTTNLTNAPTAGDLTATMKTSVTTAAASALTTYDPPTHAELTAGLAAADDAVLAAVAALNNLSAAGIRTAVGLASPNLDTQLADLPTNAELATSQATADDATLAAIAARPSAAAIAAAVLAAATADPIAASVEEINGVAVTGGGTAGSKWRPA